MKLWRGERGEVTTFVVIVLFMLAGGTYGLFAGLQTGSDRVKKCMLEEAQRNPDAKLGLAAPLIAQECKP